jgi:transposase
VAKRLRAVVLNSEGHTSGKLAEILQSPRSKVSEWLQRYQTDGIDGLLEGYRSGRPAQLTEKQQQQLGDILDSGPVAYGLDTGIWTSPMIAWVIEEEFGVQYHPGHVRKLLHGWGFSMQRPDTDNLFELFGGHRHHRSIEGYAFRGSSSFASALVARVVD